MKTAYLVSAVLLALGSMSLVSPAHAEEPQLRHVRVCDTSACYYAWNVVDSDNDGFSDADEIAAGSDPFDPDSRPPLSRIVDLIGARLLPTFEFGVGRMTVKPAELQAELEARGGGESPLTAFPLGQRKDAMTRMGLDPKLLAKHGYDAEFDGLTLVQGHDDNGGPVRRVGGVDIRLISGGDAAGEPAADAPQEGPKVVHFEKFTNGDTFVRLDNGDEILIKKDGGVERTGADGMPKKGGYYNPDADSGSGEPTEEQIKAWERVRNVAVRVVAGWEPITGDPEDIRDPNETIILVDPDYQEQEGEVFEPPQIDRAQPETRPDLPNPLQQGGGCWPKCGG